MPRLNPLTVRKLKRFREIRRGYYSTVLLVLLTGTSLFAELMVSDKAIVVSYEGQWFFPTYADVKLGAEFGLTGTDALIPVNYRDLAERFEEISYLLSDPNVIGDQNRFRELSQEYAQLNPVVDHFRDAEHALIG